MKFGLFDHVEDGERPLATLFDERLVFARAADDAGIYCLHVAEHHATPLNMVPAPGIYLGAVARATKRMRLGPLVYLLPLYSPLRLIEEICILDHLSYGRMEVGVGRGVSPFELKYHKIEHDDSREIFIDAFNCVSAGLTTDTLNYSGKHYQYENVPIALRPLQQPHPAFWYGSSNTTGSTWAGEHGMHFVSLGPTPFAKTNIDAFKQALAKRGGPAQPKAEFPGVYTNADPQISACKAPGQRFAPGAPAALDLARGGDGLARMILAFDGKVEDGHPSSVRGPA